MTITLDPDVHARAKEIAQARHTTVSGLVEAFVRSERTKAADASKVDPLLGSAQVRTLEAGLDATFDALRARHIARSR